MISSALNTEEARLTWMDGESDFDSTSCEELDQFGDGELLAITY